MNAAPVRSGTVLLAASAVVFLAAGFRSVRAPDLHVVLPRSATRLPTDVRFIRPMPASIGEMQEAFDANPFSASRSRPSVRFGQVDLGPSRMPAPSVDIRNARLLGTTVAGTQSFALLEEPGQPAKVLRLKDMFLGFSVKSIERGRVVLSARDSTIVFDMNKGVR